MKTYIWTTVGGCLLRYVTLFMKCWECIHSNRESGWTITHISCRWFEGSSLNYAISCNTSNLQSKKCKKPIFEQLLVTAYRGMLRCTLSVENVVLLIVQNLCNTSAMSSKICKNIYLIICWWLLIEVCYVVHEALRM